jgi:1-acyl-sn-glycerol-3-phosphate acyltransferase
MSRSLAPEEIASLRRQSLVGRAAFTFVGPAAVFYMRVVRGHRIEGMREVRRLYGEVLAQRRPVLVCANHLTLVDSIYLHHAFASIADYLADFRRFSWNVPAVENFKRNPFLRALTYVGKTVPIDRRGDAAHLKKVLDTIKLVVSNGDVCTLFPEGGRSRTGRVEPDKVTSGIGNILKDLDRPIVFCAYLRGERQETWGALPAWGDTLHITAEAIEPRTDAKGMKASKELARQVIEKLKELEDRHFARGARSPP